MGNILSACRSVETNESANITISPIEDDNTIIIRGRSFDEAIGPGAFSIGGKAAPMRTVTNNVEGTIGSFRNSLTYPGKREVNFVTDNLNYMTAPVKITNGYITIDGRGGTKPACVVGSSIVFEGANDIILRYVSFRGVNIIFTNCTNFIIDHCEFMYGSLVITNSLNCTIQWSRLEEEKITFDNPRSILSFYNLFSDCTINASNTDFINCAFYNYRSPHYSPIIVIDHVVRMYLCVFYNYNIIDENVETYKNITLLSSRSVGFTDESSHESFVRERLGPDFDENMSTFLRDPIEAHNIIVDAAGTGRKKFSESAVPTLTTGVSIYRSKILPKRICESVVLRP
jgi:hypothetical protein